MNQKRLNQRIIEAVALESSYSFEELDHFFAEVGSLDLLVMAVSRAEQLQISLHSALKDAEEPSLARLLNPPPREQAFSLSTQVQVEKKEGSVEQDSVKLSFGRPHKR